MCRNVAFLIHLLTFAKRIQTIVFLYLSKYEILMIYFFNDIWLVCFSVFSLNKIEKRRCTQQDVPWDSIKTTILWHIIPQQHQITCRPQASNRPIATNAANARQVAPKTATWITHQAWSCGCCNTTRPTWRRNCWNRLPFGPACRARCATSDAPCK